MASLAAGLAYALHTGVKPSGDAFGKAIGEVVRFGTQFLTDEDLKAMGLTSWTIMVRIDGSRKVTW